MYCFTPALRYWTAARSEGRAFADGFFGLAFSHAPWVVGAYVLVSLLQYSVPLLFLLLFALPLNLVETRWRNRLRLRMNGGKA